MTGAEDLAYRLAVGRNLLTIRQARNLTLAQVQEKSGGALAAGVVGSYERASRNVTVDRLAELATFYQIPVTAILPGQHKGPATMEMLELGLAIDALKSAWERVIGKPNAAPEGLRNGEV